MEEAAAESMQEQAQNLTRAVSIFRLAENAARTLVKTEKQVAAAKGQAAVEKSQAIRRAGNAKTGLL